MELFRDTKFDFLGWKWPFIGASVVLLAVGMASLAMRGGPLLGIDFRGGAVMNVKFASPPPVQRIRSALSSKISGAISVTNFGESGVNEVLIGTEVKNERDLNAARDTIVKTLETTFAPNVAKLDFNNVGQEALANGLRDPLQRAGVGMSDQQLKDLAAAMLDFRNTPPRSGLIRGFDELKGVSGVTPAVIAVLKQELSLAPFAIRQAQVVGPKVGADLRWQAVRATLYALAGMLVYIAFRFEWIYGVAAVVAVLHDTLITIGLFSLFSKEIDLTVVAALLTLVGYSMNDTIVVFDRIRENLKILKRMDLATLINLSVNQTLSRTVLTSGLTFLTAAALFLFGGPVLNGFAFALVVGIIIGTYSSVFVASPILVFWQDFAESRGKSPRAAAGKETEVRSELSRGPEKPKARKG
jgi:protein-export membrane protein, SecD/SecF family/protein-export membrane protein SecF